jgi:integrase
MVLLAVLTGLRVGEILALRWQDLDLEKGELRVEQAIYRGCLGSPKTKGSKRTLPLPQAAIAALQALARRLGALQAPGLAHVQRTERPRRWELGTGE